MNYLYAESPVLTAQSLHDLNAMRVAVETQFPISEIDESVRAEDQLDQIAHPVVRRLGELMLDNRTSALSFSLENGITVDFIGDDASIIYTAMHNYVKNGPDLFYRENMKFALKSMTVTHDRSFTNQLLSTQNPSQL